MLTYYSVLQYAIIPFSFLKKMHELKECRRRRPGLGLGSAGRRVDKAASRYRVGDYVCFENSSSDPYPIRRIEELNKTATGNVEAKVVCF